MPVLSNRPLKPLRCGKKRFAPTATASCDTLCLGTAQATAAISTLNVARAPARWLVGFCTMASDGREPNVCIDPWPVQFASRDAVNTSLQLLRAREIQVILHPS